MQEQRARNLSDDKGGKTAKSGSLPRKLSPFLGKNGVESPCHSHGTQVLEGCCAKAAAQTLETKLASGMGDVESGGGIQVNAASCVPVTPVCSSSLSRVTPPRKGLP